MWLFVGRKVEALADFLDEKRREISDRLRELQPLVDEYHRLQAAQSALEGVPAQQADSARPRPRARARARGASTGATRTAGSGRRGRPRGSGTRSKEALELVRKSPGISIPE